MRSHTLTSAFLCGPTLNLEAGDPEQSLALLTPGRGEHWFEDIAGVRDTPMLTSALTTVSYRQGKQRGDDERGKDAGGALSFQGSAPHPAVPAPWVHSSQP